jgi:hypothetical protein
MGTSFARFVRTGQLGPLTLGMDPSAVELQLGIPDARSRKHNPLIMKYGPLELTFWSPRSQPPQLTQILLEVARGQSDLPGALLFDDLMPYAVSHINDFLRFMEQIGVWPEEVLRGDRESSIALPSGVKASFIDGQLRALALSKRERDENRSPILTDEHEPTVEQIGRQLEEARSALRHGFVSAAVVLAWGALEAALRRSALRAGYKGKVRVQPTILIREAHALGLLNSEQVRILESARQQRTTIAHGLMSAPVDSDVVLQIILLAEHLLRGDGLRGGGPPLRSL